MGTIFRILLLSSALATTSAAASGKCFPAFVKVGGSYEMTSSAGRFKITVKDIDHDSCWLKVGDHEWVNKDAIVGIKE